jgi:DNA-binding transcriptional regulator GbsR (MarR family)
MTTFNVRDTRRKNWFSIDNTFLRGGWGAKLGPTGIAVYAAIVLHADSLTQSGYPSHQTLANLTGMSKRQVIRKVNDLKDLNVIATTGKLGETLTYYLLDKSEWKTVPLPKKGKDAQSQGGMTDSHTNNTHVNNTHKQNNAVGEKDYLDAVVDFAKQMDKNDDRPKGWRDASEGEYRICERVASLWVGGRLPWAANDIEKQLAAAYQILNLFDGNEKEALWTIDEFHAEKGDDLGFMVLGPYSLRNALPLYLAERENDNGRNTARPADPKRPPRQTQTRGGQRQHGGSTGPDDEVQPGLTRGQRDAFIKRMDRTRNGPDAAGPGDV